MSKPDFSSAALENIAETSTNWEADLAALRCGEITTENLLALCLNGADEDREQGWRDYVGALSAAV